MLSTLYHIYIDLDLLIYLVADVLPVFTLYMYFFGGHQAVFFYWEKLVVLFLGFFCVGKTDNTILVKIG